MLNLFQSIQEVGGGRCHLYFRVDIMHIKRLSKYTPNTFSRCKPPLNRQFFHVLSSFVHYVLTSNQYFFFVCKHDRIHTLFPQFCMFVPPNNVRTYCLVLKKLPNLHEFFKIIFHEDIHPHIQVLPFTKLCFGVSYSFQS